jgi:hypothetical protein
MSHNSDNRKRAFADVVTIDAWHESFGDGPSKVDLHADVVFGTARIGGESESPVRFRLSVKRAEVVVVIPALEPLSVDRRSVSRDAPERQGRLTEVVEQSTQANAKGAFAASVSHTGLSGSASAEGGAQATISASKKLEVSATLQFMIVTQSKTSEGHYRWAIEPTTTKILEGRPWDPTKQPRLKLVDERKDRSKGIPPTVRVEVRCRREDLSIEDLEIKDENLWEALKGRVGFRNRIAAAESYIRDRLSAEGLEVNNIQDIFGQLTLGSVSAESA